MTCIYNFHLFTSMAIKKLSSYFGIKTFSFSYTGTIYLDFIFFVQKKSPNLRLISPNSTVIIYRTSINSRFFNKFFFSFF